MANLFKKFYRNLFQGQLFVIKASGSIITDKKARENLLSNIKELNSDGINVLFIYGGGSAIDEAITAEGRQSTKIDGRRITSENDIRTIKKTLTGDLGFKLSESLVKGHMDATVLNAISPHWAIAKRRPKKNGITRFDGTLSEIKKNAVWDHFTSTNLAICPCLAFTKQGTALNINADNVAIEMAASIKAHKLILMTNIDGVMVNDKVASVLTAKEIEQLIADGIVTDGMQVKLENCISALRSGVKRVHILNGFKKDALRNEIYTSEGFGTMIVRENEKKRYIKEEIKT